MRKHKNKHETAHMGTHTNNQIHTKTNKQTHTNTKTQSKRTNIQTQKDTHMFKPPPLPSTSLHHSWLVYVPRCLP